MATREVAALIWANGVSTLNATMLKNEAAHRCANVRGGGKRRLRPCSSESDVRVRTPSVRLETRMLNGGISSSAIFIIGQVTPQPRHRRTRKTRALVASAGPGRGRSVSLVDGDMRAARACKGRPDRPNGSVVACFRRPTTERWECRQCVVSVE